MSLVKGSTNPLNVLGARRLSYIPDHFAKMTFSDTVSKDSIDVWIYQNLDSRYAIIKTLKLDSGNKLLEVNEIGVEDPKELTMLSLSCPYLHK